MPWKELNIEEWARKRGIDINELREKEKLIKRIVSIRKNLKLTQADIAKLVGVSQSRIAQIESRIKIEKISFDVLINILRAMGYGFTVSTRKLREPDLGMLAA